MTGTQNPLAVASRALKEGRLAEAERILTRTLQLQPYHLQARSLLAITLARKGELQRSLGELEVWLSLDPSSVECLNWTSIVLRRMGQLEEAEEASLQAVRLQPANPDSLNNLGLVQLGLGKPAQALQQLSAAVAANTGNPQFVHNLGIALQSLGRDKEAADQFLNATRLSASAFPSYLALGSLMLRHGNPAGAYQAANEVLRQVPTSVDAHLLAARALTNLGEGDRSEQHLREVIRLDPQNSVALGMLGFRLQFSGRFEEARLAFEASLRLNENQGIGYWGLWNGKRATPADRPELERLKDLAESFQAPLSEKGYLHYALGKAHSELAEYQAAMNHYDEANRIAVAASLGGRPFDSERYAEAIDETISLFSSEFIDRHRYLGCSSFKPIFIVGMMRSGTTLMEQILSSHPHVSAGGELQFWLERAPKVVDAVNGIVDAERAQALVNDYLSLLTRIAPETRVTDKMPQNIQVVGLIRILFPQAKIVHMSRNPVDTCLSIYFTPYESPPDFAHVKENIAFAFGQNRRLAEHWRRQVGADAFFEVQYEELVEDSEAVIRRVLNFCNLEWDERCLRHTENDRAVNTPSVWQVRQPIYRTSVSLWKNYEPYLGAFADLLA